MASAEKLAGIAAILAIGLGGLSWAYAVRIRHNPQDRPGFVQDAIESEKVRRQSLYGALLFGFVTVVLLIVAVI